MGGVQSVLLEGNGCGVDVIERSDLLLGRSFNYWR